MTVTTTPTSKSAAGMWHQYAHVQPTVGSRVLTYVQSKETGSTYFSLGNPGPGEEVLWWAYLFYPPRVVEEGVVKE